MENLARQKNNKNKENRLIASGAATISFLPNLKLKSSVALDRRNGVSTTFLDPISTTDGRNSFGTASDNRNMNTVLVFDNILTYNTNIKKHGIDVMAGSSYTKSDYTNSWMPPIKFHGTVPEQELHSGLSLPISPACPTIMTASTCLP